MKIKLNIIKGLGILLLTVAGFTSSAQQDPMFTQYMFNTQTINPAYAGTWESLSFMVIARQQWTGITGAPETYSFSMQAPLKNERVALGLNVINDKVGLEKRFYLFGDYSYLVPLSEKSNLRLGLKGGFTNYTNNLQQYQTNAPGSGVVDEAFLGEIDRKWMPNFGVGAFLYGQKYFVGLSVPKIIRNDFENNYNNLSITSEIQHYFLTAGLVFDLGENLKFKPTMLTKATFSSETGAPVQMDFTANFLINIAQWIIDKKLRIGYSFDYTTSNLRNYQHGSHEIMISYELKFLKERFASPRYF